MGAAYSTALAAFKVAALWQGRDKNVGGRETVDHPPITNSSIRHF